MPALAGQRVGVTADRRATEQTELLVRLGAEVLHGPMLRTLPFGNEKPLRGCTEALLVDPPTILVVSTGIGLRGWIGAAESWGLADALMHVLGRARIHVRGPKAFAAAAQVGLAVTRQEPSERLDALVRQLVTDGLQGEHVALQLHGSDEPEVVAVLERAGARVTCVSVYEWVPPADEAPARRLIREAVDGQLTAVTFMSPSAVTSACRIAAIDGLRERLVDALGSRVAVACVGPTTRAAAEAAGFRVTCSPTLGRLGLLVRSLAMSLRSGHIHLGTPRGEVVLQGRLLVMAHSEISLADRERQVLHLLAQRAGLVVSRTAIEHAVWRSTDEDRALDAVLSRMRRHLAPSHLEIETRHRRGYQLRAEVLPCNAIVARLDLAVGSAGR